MLVDCHYVNNIVVQTRNSATASKPREAFVQIERRGSPLKTRPSPYVLPCRIYSFCVKGCRHKYRRTSKIGERWNSAILGWEEDWLQDTCPFHMCYHVIFGNSASKAVCINRKEPHSGERWYPPPCGRGVADPRRNTRFRCVLSCRIWSFYVKRYERYYGDRLKILTPRVPPSRSLKVIGTDMHRSATYN